MVAVIQKPVREFPRMCDYITPGILLHDLGMIRSRVLGGYLDAGAAQSGFL